MDNVKLDTANRLVREISDLEAHIKTVEHKQKDGDNRLRLYVLNARGESETLLAKYFPLKSKFFLDIYLRHAKECLAELELEFENL